MEVEDNLRDIVQREASWGGMLSSAPAAAVPSERSNGTDGGSINGRTAAKGDGLIVGVGASNGAGGDILPETRTLV